MSTQDDDSSTLPISANPAHGLPAIPGYEVLELVGRGGMGKVYRARHLALGRVVALKVLAHETSDKLQARFREEARAVAKLQHPNIAQLFESGTTDGRPFYTQEFLDGGTLAEKYQGEPQNPTAAATVIETVARAVQHSHANGILHRDLKPGNIMLAADGTPKVTDFGLAKSLTASEPGSTPADGAGLTRTGEVVGTPGYMPPEQASGAGEIGPGVDIYALGAVLYEALTGRPPFRAADPIQTIMMVLTMEAVSPRTLQPDVPRDLETICLKCLEKSPRKRYASAGELADDLRRFLSGEPILARPVGFFERSAKWARRKPWQAVAAALGVLFVALLAAGVVVLAEKNGQVRAANGQLEQTNGELEQANRNLTAAKEETDRANKNLSAAKTETEQTLELALRALDTYYFQLSDKLREVPRGEKLRVEVLAQARKTLDVIHTFRPNDPRIRAFQIEGFDKLGNAEMAVGDLAGATADYRRCREIAGELESRFPAEPAYRRYRALADVKLATAERYGGDQKAADRRLEGTRPAVKELVAAFPDDPRVWDLESALTLELLGTALREDRGDDAETHARRLAELARKLAAAEPGNVPRTVTVVEADSRLALLLMERGKLDAAWKELSRATEGLAALPDPGPVGVRSLRGSVFGNLGWYHDRRKQTKEAAAAYRKSADQYVALATDFPDSPLYRYQAAESLYYCGLDRIVLLDPQEGFRLLERAAGYTAELTRTHPKDERYRELHARITGTLTRLRTRKATE